MAKSLADPRLQDILMSVFCQCFHQPQPQELPPAAQELVQAVAQNFDQVMAKIMEGGGEIEIAGQKAKLIPLVPVAHKVAVNKKKKAKTLPPPNPWN